MDSTPKPAYRIFLARHAGLGGGWCATVQRDAGNVYGTEKTCRDEHSLDALLQALAVAGYEPNDEQRTELGRDCQIMDQGSNAGWQLELWTKNGTDWGCVVEENVSAKIGFMTGLSMWKDPFEAAIRALNRAVAGLAKWV